MPRHRLRFPIEDSDNEQSSTHPDSALDEASSFTTSSSDNIWQGTIRFTEEDTEYLIRKNPATLRNTVDMIDDWYPLSPVPFSSYGTNKTPGYHRIWRSQIDLRASEDTILVNSNTDQLVADATYIIVLKFDIDLSKEPSAAKHEKKLSGDLDWDFRPRKNNAWSSHKPSTYTRPAHILDIDDCARIPVSMWHDGRYYSDEWSIGRTDVYVKTKLPRDKKGRETGWEIDDVEVFCHVMATRTELP